ncbi:GNAT family N-acetyltransferase [Alterisphingorhabdus coralli]|uniref:GNAT family N-acetyltransferase n=1 Tax=Alterisphingorhabdus coralli TaxID=3071408 RepID=A0AA97F874_9SPHN|nr:GNAT family N-acetyltransferase [Parasphingorhabdus sp. SCSIO 66989]WOE74847.1 GNAT family N-acetyltransferase [Parasphingorhabdus sp. SCSIO 66989]
MGGTDRPVTAPRIVTDRLILRAFERADFDAFCGIRNKPEVVKHISTEPQSRSQLWQKFAYASGLWPLLGHGVWAVERREGGQLIGDVALADYQRDFSPPLPGPAEPGRFGVSWPEASWLFDSEVHGQGYASEALTAALDWADTHLAVPLVCIITPDNLPSIRLAERHGFIRVGERIHSDDPVIVFQRG